MIPLFFWQDDNLDREAYCLEFAWLPLFSTLRTLKILMRPQTKPHYLREKILSARTVTPASGCITGRLGQPDALLSYRWSLIRLCPTQVRLAYDRTWRCFISPEGRIEHIGRSFLTLFPTPLKTTISCAVSSSIPWGL